MSNAKFLRIQVIEHERELTMLINISSISSLEPNMGSTLITLTNGEQIMSVTDLENCANQLGVKMK